MGAWGTAPWENDRASEWFDKVVETWGLPSRVEAALALDVEAHHEEVRAAAYLLAALGQVYIWPVDRLDRHLKLAVQKLRQIQGMEIYRSAGFTEAIEQEIVVLESRVRRA